MRFISLAGLLLGLAASAAAQSPAPASPPAPAALPAESAPAEAPRKPRRLKVLPVPIIFYQSASGLGYGAGALVSGSFGKDSLTRPSTIRTQLWRTQRGQSLVQLVHTVFTPNERMYAFGEISLYALSFDYYGIGNDTRRENESPLDFRLFVIAQRLQWQVKPRIFAGFVYRYTDLWRLDFSEPTVSGQPNFFGRDPLLSPRERERTRVSGFGPALTLDTRDNASAAYRGSYVDLETTVQARALGSEFNFTRIQLDARHYRPLGSTRTVLAGQFMGQLNLGTVPFRELAGLAANFGTTLYNNTNLMRGLDEQRIRDRQLITFQAELRQRLFWRFGGTVFGGVGQVARDVSDFGLSRSWVAGGAGLRFALIRRDRINLRLDYAVGRDSSPVFYFSVNEAF